MDPFSITAGVVGTAGVALHSARRVKDFIDGIRGAPRAVSDLSKDLEALANVLETLNTFVNQVHQSGDAARTELVLLLKPPLENCTTITESILLTVKPYTKPSGEPKKSKWRGFVWTFREREVLTLQKTLLDYKISLDISISVANLTTLRGLSDIKRSIHGMRQRLEEDQESMADSSFLGSAAAGSDHGYALKRYLLETETVLGDLPSSPTAASEPDLPSSDHGGQPSILPWGLAPDSDDDPCSDNDEVTAVPVVRTRGDGKGEYLPAEHTGTAPSRFSGLQEPRNSIPTTIMAGDTTGIKPPMPILAFSPPLYQQESPAEPWQEASNLGGHASTLRPQIFPQILPPLSSMPRSPAEAAHRITPTARDTQVPSERGQPEHVQAWRSYNSGPTSSRTKSLGHARREGIQARRQRREEATKERAANVPEETDADLRDEDSAAIGGVPETPGAEYSKPVYLKGLFSVSTTSIRSAQFIPPPPSPTGTVVMRTMDVAEIRRSLHYMFTPILEIAIISSPQAHLAMLAALALTLPTQLKPTVLQLQTPHHAYIDMIPSPSLRDRLITVGPIDSNTFMTQACTIVCDIEDTGQMIVWGEDCLNEDTWEFSAAVLDRWGGWLLPQEWGQQANFWRRQRGAPTLSAWES